MKKTLFFGCIAAALLSFASCEQSGNDYDGTNYIYLEAQNGKTTIYGTDSEPLTIEVMLTKALEEDLTITFELHGKEGVVELAGNPVTVAAGEKTASFSVVSLNANVLEASENYSVSVSSLLPDGVELKSPLQFVVSPMSVEALTDAQKAIIDAYKASTGIDLSKYIGVLNVSVEYTAYDFNQEVLLDPETFTGKSVIALSDDATSEAPVLKMVSNPMGIQDKMYALLRSLTVEYSDYWCDGEYFPDNVNLMNTISWNAESSETFSMSLDAITFGADGAIGFVGAGLDQYGDEIAIVPFSYEFSAYERELEAIESGKFVKIDEYSTDCTANPAYHLNNSDISEDGFEEKNFAQASAVIMENGDLVFTFCMATAMDSDYTKVVATYTPNN